MHYSVARFRFSGSVSGSGPIEPNETGHKKLARASADAVRISYVRMVELREESGLSLKISQHIVCSLLLDRKNSQEKR